MKQSESGAEAFTSEGECAIPQAQEVEPAERGLVLHKAKH